MTTQTQAVLPAHRQVTALRVVRDQPEIDLDGRRARGERTCWSRSDCLWTTPTWRPPRVGSPTRWPSC